MKREVGGGIGMGKTCKPKAVSFQCMTKFTTNKKKKWITNKDLLYSRCSSAQYYMAAWMGGEFVGE